MTCRANNGAPTASRVAAPGIVDAPLEVSRAERSVRGIPSASTLAVGRLAPLGRSGGGTRGARPDNRVDETRGRESPIHEGSACGGTPETPDPDSEPRPSPLAVMSTSARAQQRRYTPFLPRLLERAAPDGTSRLARNRASTGGALRLRDGAAVRNGAFESSRSGDRGVVRDRDSPPGSRVPGGPRASPARRPSPTRGKRDSSRTSVRLRQLAKSLLSQTSPPIGSQPRSRRRSQTSSEDSRKLNSSWGLMRSHRPHSR